MADKREIEGTAERAADRGREEDLGFNTSALPSLGDADVVRQLVSKFGADVVAVRRDYLEDKLNSKEAQSRVRELAADYGSIVMGRDKDYSAMPWNSEPRLGRRIKMVVPAIEGVNEPGELLFLTVGTSLSSLAASHEAGRVTDEDAEHHTKVMLEDTVNLILGLR